MSTVRIPRPEDDRLPLAAMAGHAALGAALGIAIAWWGMERDRSETSVSGNETVTESATGPETGTATEAETLAVAEAEAEAETGAVAEADAETGAEAETVAEAGAETEAETEAEAGAETAAVAEAVAETAPRPATGGTGSLTLRPGRVAYLRCEGVPQREGPFPCPRDEALEAAVWQGLHRLEGCAPSAGEADVVVDFDASEAPTIRIRDTFPPDTVRLDGPAVLACVGETLMDARSTLRPRRLLVSFRLALAAPAR